MTTTMRGKGKKPGPFLLYDNEYLVECPYNMSHQVTNFRMMTHLIKCRRNHAKEQDRKGEAVMMLVCKYNWTHQIPAPEILYHEESCSDRYSVVPHMLQFEQLAESNSTEPSTANVMYFTQGTSLVGNPKKDADEEVNQNVQPIPQSSGATAKVPMNYDDTEDWEGDCRRRGYQSYNPQVKLDSEVILRYPPNMTKSERKAYRQSNMEKAQRMFAGLGIKASKHSSGTDISSDRASEDNFEAVDLADYGLPIDEFNHRSPSEEKRSQAPSERSSVRASQIQKAILEEMEMEEGNSEAVEISPADKYKVYLEKALKSGLAGLRRRDALEKDLAQGGDFLQVPNENKETFDEDSSDEDDQDWNEWVPMSTVKF